jgi:hypothetical protein
MKCGWRLAELLLADQTRDAGDGEQNHGNNQGGRPHR